MFEYENVYLIDSKASRNVNISFNRYYWTFPVEIRNLSLCWHFETSSVRIISHTNVGVSFFVQWMYCNFVL